MQSTQRIEPHHLEDEDTLSDIPNRQRKSDSGPKTLVELGLRILQLLHFEPADRYELYADRTDSSIIAVKRIPSYASKEPEK